MTQNRNFDYGRSCIDQYNRVCRWYKRFEQITAEPSNLDLDKQFDEVLAFFMNCYHLHDWIIHDISDDQTKNEVRELIKNNECFQLCHDICIGAKHLDVNRPRFKEDLNFETRDYVNFCGPILKQGQVWVITTNTGKRFNTFFQIAHPCMEKWVIFFEQHKDQLLTTKSSKLDENPMLIRKVVWENNNR